MMHTLREGNSCAYDLAKLGRMQLDEDLVILHRPPHSKCNLSWRLLDTCYKDSLLSDLPHLRFVIGDRNYSTYHPLN
ncbi:hypothetical protein RDI58_024222 [Solanum bulbocastanum]|uniref:Uncharacterized protein n=1 Tax=Solanum bulbocastanum TaxID=147425 RepID=A0AAN8Y2R3_SOLBU